MSKFQKIMLGAFCGGVLLCGLGAGIAFTEFSALSYGGEKLLGGAEMVTEEIDAQFTPGENKYYVYSGYSEDVVYSELLTDESVPENTVRFEVVYNAARVEPEAFVNPECDEIVLHWYWDRMDDVEYMMQAKDEILADLKNGEISSYNVEIVKEVRVLVNPANVDDVQLVL